MNDIEEHPVCPKCGRKQENGRFGDCVRAIPCPCETEDAVKKLVGDDGQIDREEVEGNV